MYSVFFFFFRYRYRLCVFLRFIFGGKVVFSIERVVKRLTAVADTSLYKLSSQLRLCARPDHGNPLTQGAFPGGTIKASATTQEAGWGTNRRTELQQCGAQAARRDCLTCWLRVYER